MPACARKEVFDPNEVGYYHCYSRCVRRAYLCGDDQYSGENYSHRQDWLEERLEFLAAHMALDVLGHAILDNHHHLVLRNRPDIVRKWKDREVARRWLILCPGKRVLDNSVIEPTDEQVKELLKDKEKLAEIRERLSSISWFHRFYKEAISRRCNIESNCSGTFWEKRFECTRLLDPWAILMGTMYVDLNRIRAMMAKTPETSEHTSVYLRIRARQARIRKPAGKSRAKMTPAERKAARQAAAWLAPVDEEDEQPPDGQQAAAGRRASDEGFLPMTLDQYLELVDWSGRQLRDGKRGAIPAELEPILSRLGMEPDLLVKGMQKFQKWFAHFAGQASKLAEHAEAIGRKWVRGVGQLREANG